MPFDARVRILLVDDDPGFRLLTEHLLGEVEEWDPRLEWAPTYEEGLRMLTESPFDAALVDYMLGERSGLEFLREEEVRAAGIPVIMLTGKGGRDIDLMAARAGAADYLRKGTLTGEELERSIRYAVEAGRRSRTEALFEALVEHGRDLVSILEPDGSARYVSPSLVRVLGFEPEEMRGADLMNEVHPDDRPGVEEALGRLMADPERVEKLRYRVRHREGGWRMLDTVARNLLGEPFVGGIVVNSWDVTELHRTEEALRQRQADLQERVKELRVLYRVREVLHEGRRGWDEALRDVVESIPPGFHYPERMAARLHLDGATWETEGFRTTEWCLEVPIHAGEEGMGRIEVCFVHGPPEDPDAPFLAEERPLVQVVADLVGDAVARRRAEAELEASEAYYRALIERSGLAVAVVDEKGVVGYIGGEVQALLGRPTSEILGRTITEVVPSADAVGVREMLDAALRDPDATLEGTAYMRPEDGVERHVEYTVRSLLDDEAVQGIVLTARDVTERTRQEGRIRFQSELLERVGQPVLATDPQGRVTYWNRAAERVLGWTEEEMLGQPFIEKAVPPELLDRALRIRGQVDEGEPWEGEIPLQRKDGRRVIVQGTVAPIRDDGGAPVGRIAAGADITDLRRAEAELREQKELLASVAANAPVVLFALDREGRIRLSEGKGLGQLGVEPGEVVGRSYFELFGERPDIGDDARRVLAGEGLHTVRRVAGRVYETWWSPLGTTGGAVGVTVDITEQREAERTRERLLDLVDATPDFVGMATAEGDVLFLNRAALRITGLGEEQELEGIRIDDIHPPWTMKLLREEGLPTARLEGSWTGETAVLDRHGEEIPMWQVVVAHRSADGEVDVLSMVARDLTERNRTAQRIRFQADLLDAVGQAVIATDLAGTITHWNRAAEELYGWTREEAVGRDILELTPSDHSRDEAGEIMEQLRTGRMWTGEMEVRGKDGTAFPALVTDAPLMDAEGRLVGMVGISQDLTERKALETELRQAQKMEAIGRLAGGVAHDFNNLLTAVQGHAELLLADLPSGSSLRDEVLHIRAAGQRAAELTRQLLAFSRKQMLEDRVLDLRRVVREMEPMLRRLIPASVELRFEAAGEETLVKADPSQMQQVIMNLAVNAGDAMGERGVLSVGVDATELTMAEADELPWKAEPGPYARLTVSDTGVGISPEVLQHIFEPFYTTKEEGKGTGLGLSTVFGIVKQSGGHVFVESPPGEGATFRILLPRVEGVAEELPPPPASPPMTDPGRHTILLVEDDDSVRELSRRVLERRGWEVLEAVNGREALAVAGERGAEIDLVLSDVVMPEMSGTRLVELLRERHPDLQVVLTSGYSEEELAGGVRGKGAAFLGKPFTPEELVRVVEDTLARPGGAGG